MTKLKAMVEANHVKTLRVSLNYFQYHIDQVVI